MSVFFAMEYIMPLLCYKTCVYLTVVYMGVASYWFPFDNHLLMMAHYYLLFWHSVYLTGHHPRQQPAAIAHT